jgi:hypothetical protein
MEFNLLGRIKNIFKHEESNKSIDENDLDYVDLAPIDNIPDKSEYFNAFNRALKNDKVRNIAISGPYGSGKSSIIETYLKNNPKVNKKAINIAIASFETEDNINDNNAPSMGLLEKSILKQLFYKVDHKEIPQSRYRKLHKICRWKVFSYLVALLFFAVFFVYIFAPDIIKNISDKIIEAGNKYSFPSVMSWFVFIIVILISVFMASQLAFKLLSNAQIKEIKLPADTKVESKVDPDSIFNKNLDEIMYFFEVTDYCYVFFEDLDRFNDIEIFEKIRELNILLNNYDNIRKCKIIKFIYAVRDDIFTNEDRTKFFDFIIPVIPVMNSTNSADVLIEMLRIKDKDKQHDISQEYIFDVAPYITDMRVLNNIYNEFILYRRTLRNSQNLNLKDKEMLSLIVFKNLYPKDFADLQAETGVVKEAFSKINQSKREVTKELVLQIERYEQQIDEAENEVLNEKREIKIAMLSALTGWNGQVYRLRIGDIHNRTEYSINSIMNDSFDINKLYGQHVIIDYRVWNGNNDSINCKNEILESYIKRWNNLFESKKHEALKAIENNKNKIREINTYSLKKLIEVFDVEKVLPEKVRANKLLTFLLRRGYINEKYANYINYFKGISLTIDDMNFILSVKNHVKLDYVYSLTKTNMIISQLQEFEFHSKEIYNYDLLNSLLSSDKNNSKLEAFIEQLSNDDEVPWEFIDGFIENCKNKAKFIKILSHIWQEMWEVIYNNSKITYERKTFYLRLIFAYADIEDIKEQEDSSCYFYDDSNDKGLISKFMIEHSDIIHDLIDKSQETVLENEKLKKIISELSIEFEKISSENVDTDIIDFIFDNDYYVINSYMIREIVKYKNATLLDELTTKNYSTILKLNYEPLLTYIHENLDVYMNYVFFDEKNIHENIDSIIILITKYLEDNEMRTRIIKHEDFCVAKISKFCGDLIEDKPETVKSIWDQLFVDSKVAANWENINIYHDNFGFSNELKEFIYSHCDPIVQSECSEVTDKLKEDIITSDIEDNVFSKLISSLNINGFSSAYDTISDSKMKILIEKKAVPFLTENYEAISETHPDLRLEFLIINQNDYISNMDDITINEDLLYDLVISPQIPHNMKQTLISKYACDFMSKSLAQIIVGNAYVINKEIFFKAWEELDENNQNKLLLNNYRLLGCDDLERCFKKLNKIYKDLDDRTRRHDVKLRYSIENEKLAEYLEKKEYITSFSIQDSHNKSDVRKLLKDKIETRIIVCKVKNMGQSTKTSL